MNTPADVNGRYLDGQPTGPRPATMASTDSTGYFLFTQVYPLNGKPTEAVRFGG